MNIKNGGAANTANTFNHNDLSAEDIEQLTAFDRNEPSHDAGYSIKFTETTAIIANQYECDLQGIFSMDSEAVSGFKATIESIADRGALSPYTLRHYASRLSKIVKDCSITTFSSDTYPLLAQRASKDTNNALTSILNTWYRLGLPGISTETIDVVNVLRAKSPPARKRITSGDSTEGWYLTQEYEDLIDTYWIDYESNKVSLRNTAALLLMGQFGKRGIQLANLKVCDFQWEGESDGLSGRRVSFPGAKDRSAENWFRGSKFEIHPVGDDLWDLCMRQIDSTIAVHEKHFDRKLTAIEHAELPFFPTGL